MLRKIIYKNNICFRTNIPMASEKWHRIAVVKMVRQCKYSWPCTAESEETAVDGSELLKIIYLKMVYYTTLMPL